MSTQERKSLHAGKSHEYLSELLRSILGSVCMKVQGPLFTSLYKQNVFFTLDMFSPLCQVKLPILHVSESDHLRSLYFKLIHYDYYTIKFVNLPSIMLLDNILVNWRHM